MVSPVNIIGKEFVMGKGFCYFSKDVHRNPCVGKKSAVIEIVLCKKCVCVLV